MEFLYTGKVDIPLSKIVPLRIAADQFQITELSSVILEYLDKNLTVDNAFRVLEQSLRCTDDLILQVCHVYSTNLFQSEQQNLYQ